MKLKEFKESIAQTITPNELSVIGQALWHDAAGDWQRAHDLIDHLHDRQSAHIHAYLHRKEGDLWNADYWYAKAGKQRPNLSLEQEWEQLVKMYLTD